MYDVITIGTGPACIMACIELIKHGHNNILMLEQGIMRSTDEKESLTSGFGGSSLKSDGKINYHHAVGTSTLPDIVGLKEYYNYLDKQEQIWLDFKPTPEQYETLNVADGDYEISRFVPNEKAKTLRAKALSHNVELSTYPILHLGSDNSYYITQNIYNHLINSGIQIKFQQCVSSINQKSDHFVVTTTKGESFKGKNVIIGIGRSGAADFIKFMKELNIPVSHGATDLGVRVEMPNEIASKLTKAEIYEPKFLYRSKTTDDACRTFCYSNDTKVYTKNGFKLFNELSQKDEFLSVNPETQEINWVKAVKFQKYKFTGNMKRVKSKQIDWLVTPDHLMYIKFNSTDKSRKPYSKYGFKKIEDLKPGHIMSCEGHWNGENFGKININGFEISSENYCELMGYYLSEGSSYIQKEHNKPIIRIPQVKNDNFEKILQLIKNSKINHRVDKGYSAGREQGKVIVIKNPELCFYLQKFGKSFEKFVPEEIKNMTPSLIKIFLDAFCLGDGSIRQVKHGFNINETYHEDRTYYTSSKKMAEDLCELILKTNQRPYIYENKTAGKKFKHANGEYITNHNIFHVSPRNRRTHQLNSIKIENEFYDDFVYDVTLEKNHTLLILRNNKIWWGSNCWNPGGFVVAEEYPHSKLITANGHSLEHTKSDNTNFAILVSKTFTTPFNDPLAYVESFCRVANLLSGGGLLVQRLGDLREGRRSTEKRIAEGSMIPTCEATPGDLSLVLPHRQLQAIVEMLETMDGVLPGMASKYTLMYGIEAKFYSNNVDINEYAETKRKNVYVIGDGSGHSRGLNASSVMGLMAAKGIIRSMS